MFNMNKEKNVRTNMGELPELFGTSGIATIYIPIHYCPLCGRKLGKRRNQKENEEGSLNYSSYREKEQIYEDAKQGFDALRKPWVERAKMIADYFQNQNASIQLDSSTSEKYKIILCGNHFFGIYMYGFNVEITEEYVEMTSRDYDEDVAGYCQISLDDFLRKDWREYFDELISRSKAVAEAEEKEKQEEKELAEYKRLRKKYNLADKDMK